MSSRVQYELVVRRQVRAGQSGFTLRVWAEAVGAGRRPDVLGGRAGGVRLFHGAIREPFLRLTRARGPLARQRARHAVFLFHLLFYLLPVVGESARAGDYTSVCSMANEDAVADSASCHDADCNAHTSCARPVPPHIKRRHAHACAGLGGIAAPAFCGKLVLRTIVHMYR